MCPIAYQSAVELNSYDFEKVSGNNLGAILGNAIFCVLMLVGIAAVQV